MISPKSWANSGAASSYLMPVGRTEMAHQSDPAQRQMRLPQSHIPTFTFRTTGSKFLAVLDSHFFASFQELIIQKYWNPGSGQQSRIIKQTLATGFLKCYFHFTEQEDGPAMATQFFCEFSTHNIQLRRTNKRVDGR